MEFYVLLPSVDGAEIPQIYVKYRGRASEAEMQEVTVTRSSGEK
jgi:hypothetical protein